MKIVERMIMVAFIILNVIIFAKAEDLTSKQADLFGVETLENAVPKETEKILGDIDLGLLQEWPEKFRKLILYAVEKMVAYLYEGLRTAVSLSVTVILCQTIDSFSTKPSRIAVRCGGALSVTAVCLSQLKFMIDVGKHAIIELAEFSMTLNPVMAAAASAAGASASSSINYIASVFFVQFLLRVSTRLLIPLLFCYLALSLADTLMENNRLKQIRDFIGCGTEIILKGSVYCFSGCLAVTGILAGSVDAAKLKATKTAMSAMIPVVGGIVSNAAQTVLASAALLKNAVGTYGMLVVIALFLSPFLHLSVYWLYFKIISILSGVLCSPLTMLLETMGKILGYLMGMTGSGALMCLISCCCYLKVVQF